MAGYFPYGFSDRIQNSWFHQLWQVIQFLKLQSSLRYHTSTTMFDCWCDVLLPDVTGHTPSKKLNFCLISSQNICPELLGIIKLFFGKCEMSLCVVFGK